MMERITLGAFSGLVIGLLLALGFAGCLIFILLADAFLQEFFGIESGRFYAVIFIAFAAIGGAVRGYLGDD